MEDKDKVFGDEQEQLDTIDVGHEEDADIGELGSTEGDDIAQEARSTEPSYPSDRDPFLLTLLYYEDVLNTLEAPHELYSVSELDTEKGFEALRSGNYQTAETHFMRALELDGKNANALVYEGIVRLYLNDLEKASQYCNLAAELSAESPNAWLCKSAILIEEHKYTEALDALDKALSISPENVEALINKGSCLIRLGNFDEAIRVIYRAQKLRYNNVHAWINKGIAYAYAFRPKDASNCFNEALVLDPDNALAQKGKHEMMNRLIH